MTQKNILNRSFITFFVAFYHLKKSGNLNDIEAHVFEVLLYAASCIECLKDSKVSNLPLSCNRFVLSASQIKVYLITKLICMIAGTVMCTHVKPVQDC